MGAPAVGIRGGAVVAPRAIQLCRRCAAPRTPAPRALHPAPRVGAGDARHGAFEERSTAAAAASVTRRAGRVTVAAAAQTRRRAISADAQMGVGRPAAPSSAHAPIWGSDAAHGTRSQMTRPHMTRHMCLAPLAMPSLATRHVRGSTRDSRERRVVPRRVVPRTRDSRRRHACRRDARHACTGERCHACTEPYRLTAQTSCTEPCRRHRRPGSCASPRPLSQVLCGAL